MQAVDISEIYPQQGNASWGIGEDAKVIYQMLYKCAQIFIEHINYANHAIVFTNGTVNFL